MSETHSVHHKKIKILSPETLCNPRTRIDDTILIIWPIVPIYSLHSRAMHLFVDTMIFLHFRPLDELRLRETLEVESLTLVVPEITIRELDKHKSTHRVRKIRNRAKRVLSELESAILDGKRLKGDIAVVYWSKHPEQELSDHQLDAQWADSVLVAAIDAYMKESGVQDVMLLSQDTGPRLTAARLGIAAKKLDDSFAIEDEPDELEIQNQQLSKQLARLQNALPKLEVGFEGSADNPAISSFTLEPHPLLDESALAQQMQRIRANYPPIPIQATSQKASDAMLRFARKLNRLPESSILEYNESLDAFYEQAEIYIRELHVYDEPKSRRIEFLIYIRNLGTAPAEDVDIYLHFPDGFTMFDEVSLPDTPTAPRRPAKPRSLSESMGSIRERSLFVPPAIPRSHYSSSPSPKSSFRIEETNSYEVTDHFVGIKHGDYALLPRMFIEFPSLEEANSFKCDYEVRLANLPDPVCGQLHFKVDVG